MIEPTIAFRKAVVDHLASDPAVSALVDPENIRAGDFRPDELPAILLGSGNVVMHGRASGAQFVATVFMDLHIWALEPGLDGAQIVGAAVARRLMDWPADGVIQFDAFRHTRTVWPRDPDPHFGHGVMSVEAVIRWSI
ncbi:hypothetical protein J2W99_005091 [Bosea robiniae]|uniref:DUF3168 domain-containing protein n=1 Tax=Bosea TaxID=85413 RepID=UPI00285AD6E4|nr:MULTISPECIES: DUF3168 domain-containing protein [Bosea]MDR6831338.1 hypothetical protein [Bosea robiniae]MDR6898094.1 hypothetical protein [Bosea sp. BE109]MDR7141475.1 hypothetical protein [Bosea sp. BE168]